ncbi:unnamed protein product, partial [Scytosiphon promiscuus]
AAAFTDPVEEVWDSLSAWHQCFIDRWPPETMAPGEGRLLIEEWLRCSDGSPHLCAERLRRLANGRACWGWPEASFRARDVADALLTGAMKLLPGGPPRGSTRGPCSPPILVVHTRLINHDRCPPALYARGLSYLMQTLAEGRRTSGAGAAGGGTRRDSEGGAVTGGGPADDDHAEVVLVIDARKDTVGVNVKKIISLFIGEGGAGPGDDRGSGGIRKSRDSPR